MGRPKKTIDPKMVRNLAKIGCKISEIAIVMECSRDTLERRFAAVFIKEHELLKTSLRRMQWASARKGNVAMQIFLGKQLLGQSDKQEISTPPGAPPTLNVAFVDKDRAGEEATGDKKPETTDEGPDKPSTKS